MGVRPLGYVVLLAFEVWGLDPFGLRPLWALAGRGEGVSPSLNPTPRAAYWRQGGGAPVQHFCHFTHLMGCGLWRGFYLHFLGSDKSFIIGKLCLMAVMNYPKEE